MAITSGVCGYIDATGTYTPYEWRCPNCNNNPCTCPTYTYGYSYPVYQDLSGIEDKLEKIIKLLDKEGVLEELEETKAELDEAMEIIREFRKVVKKIKK
jgi:hypothetical protein